ncbi:MAG: ATP-binding protein, partial [Endomicrobiaceae bacterium]|nr:ATP-binding protein [Endomicrobiaceae bacterium]
MEITNNTEQSGKQKFTYIYKDIINEVSKAVNGIENNVKNIDDDEIKATSSDTIGILNEIKNYISDSLVELEQDSDWDTFTIAFYGETNAGKSTIIETLRLVLQEKTKLQEQQKFHEISVIISGLNAKLEKLNKEIVHASKDLVAQEDQILNLEREKVTKLNEYQKLLYSFRKKRIEFVKKIKKGSVWHIPISTILSYMRQKKEAKMALIQNRAEHYKILSNKKEFLCLNNNNLTIENKNKAALEKIKESLFGKTETLNYEIQSNKEYLHLNADGAIIGDGRSDNTRTMVRYEFDVDGKKFAILDVPGIGGREDDVTTEIKKALRKTHVVFYVKSETKIEGGDTNTAGIIEKIKEQLSDQTQVYVVYNHRITSPSQICDPFLCDETIKNLAVLDSKMIEFLGKHYVKHIPLSAHFSFLVAAEKFVKDKWVDSRQKALDKLGKEDLFEKMGFTAFTDWIKKEVTENKEQKLIEANKNKITSLIKKAEEEVRNGQADLEKLYTKTAKLAQKASEEIDDAYDELSSRLSANINDAISTARNNIRIDAYSYIEQNVDNDALKAELERLSELYTE